MRKCVLNFLAILLFFVINLIPNAIAQQQYKEKFFVFSLDPSSFVPADEDCANGVAKLASRYNIYDINPTFAGRFKINSVDTWNVTGKVTNMAVEEIGDILVCIDTQTYPPEMNLLPAYHEITIGGRTYVASGAGTSPNFPELPILPGGSSIYTTANFPAPNAAFIRNVSDSVLPNLEGKTGGSFFSTSLEVSPAGTELGLNGAALNVLHVLVPVNDP